MQMAVFTKDNSIKMKSLERELITGLTRRLIEVSGLKTRCMEQVFYSGLTESSMMDNFKMISVKAMGSSRGKTVEYMTASGKKANKMAKEFLLTNLEKLDTEFGRMERILCG